MVTLRVIRRVPAPIIGVTGRIPDRQAAVFEEVLDWLETSGVLVERVDADAEPPDMRARSGDHPQLPAIHANRALVSEGRYLTRHELAHVAAQASPALPAAAVRVAATIGAAAALGDARAIAAAEQDARALGLDAALVAVALQAGAVHRTTHGAAPAA